MVITTEGFLYKPAITDTFPALLDSATQVKSPICMYYLLTQGREKVLILYYPPPNANSVITLTGDR